MCTISKPLKSNVIWRCGDSQYVRQNNGTTDHHGHIADCQLALTNVVEVQTKVVTMDWKTVGCQRLALDQQDERSVQHFQLSAVARLSECRKTHFYSGKRKHCGCQWRVEAVAGAVSPAISGSCSTDSTSRRDTANVANIPKTTMFSWHINTSHDLHTLHLCTDQEST